MCFVTNRNNKECEFVKDGIEMKDMDIQSMSSSGIYEELDNYNTTQGTISMNTTELVLNELARKMEQAKDLEQKVRRHEKMIKKMSRDTKALEQKLHELEIKRDENSTMHKPNMNIYGLDDEKENPCACKAGDNFRCLGDC